MSPTSDPSSNKNPGPDRRSHERGLHVQRSSHIRRYAEKCDALSDQQLLRQLPQPRPDRNSAEIDFSHNDYLGLSRHPKTIQAAVRAAEKWGTGATASRLLAGNLPLFSDFEQQIAIAKQQPAALIFASGFQANTSVLNVLLDPKVLNAQPRVFADRLNHSSIHRGCQSAGVRQHRYHHLDLEHLESQLEKYRDCDRPKFILTETVFGMDGDEVDVARLGEIADQYDAFLYLDEAHATGVVGPDGFGLSSLAPNAGLVMGTFSKAIGSAGAFVACSSEIKTYLINRCSGFIYSTAPSPSAIAAAQAAWELLPQLDEQRALLMQRSDQLRTDLNRLGFATGNSTTHLIPVVIGDVQQTLDARDHLAERGIIVSAIRPPTVPPNSARLRIAHSTTHSANDISMLRDAIAEFSSIKTSAQ